MSTSVRYYLKPEAPIVPGKYQNGNPCHRHLGEEVADAEGVEPHISTYVLLTEDTRTPAKLASSLRRISLRDTFAMSQIPREVGTYRWKSAFATLDIFTQRTNEYEINIDAKTLEDAVEIYFLIRSGQIAPITRFNAENAPAASKVVSQLVREIWTVLTRDLRTRWYRLTRRV